MYGHNPTSVKVAEAAQTNTSKTYFGSMFVMDCPLTTLPNISSNIIGYAQGMTASASQTELGLLMILHFVFTEREYNGSTISILGRNLVFENVREMPVVGGSGLFRFARGYAEGKTYSLDVKSGNATLEYNSKGNPQWGRGCLVCRWGNNHRVFGPTTTTRNVYDVAAHHVVNGVMEGINGTIFAYGVTSSGKTHTMHGDQRSPGIIPLALVSFSIIQETPNQEFLLRISYLELYNEVVNDLLNPPGHNLRIREDKQVCVSASDHRLRLLLSLTRNIFVVITSLLVKSTSILCITIVCDIYKSSPLGDKIQGEAVPLSQLNLVDLDLAGSESSKVETSGLRRKEGDAGDEEWGHVISKLTDVKASHVPYRDSKLIRILQSSLSGHDRVSLICTVTPASRISEETHNTLKFAHRAKHIEIQAKQNKITDEKSLIKKYQHEIRKLKEELEQLKQGTVPVPQLKDMGAHDTILLKQKLAYLPYKRRDLMDDEDIDMYVSVEGSHEIREEKKSRKHGLLNWLKPKKRDNSSSASDQSSSPLMEQLSESREDREPPEDMETLEASNKIIDELDLMREHKKILSEEAALQSSSLKRLSDEAVKSPQNEEIKVEIKDLHDGIKAKNGQIATLEKQIVDYVVTSHEALDKSDIVQAVAELRDQLNERFFELENMAKSDSVYSEEHDRINRSDDQQTKKEIKSLQEKMDLLLSNQAKKEQMNFVAKALSESKEQLERHNRKLAEESSYAKSLASAAAVELKALSEEVAKLMNHNEKLSADLATHKSPIPQRTNKTGTTEEERAF
ncbi:unnamed protein product [Brassica oleracea var. botrytis]